ncbi:MAG TPA: thioredoxin family protein [Chitinophagaceae bacterium]|nr:thioredoxin family protein [Chitinophagaceae bacterium]
MKKLILLTALCVSSYMMQAQDFVRELDRKSDKVLLRGKINFNDLLKESTFQWLEKGAADYKPNAQVIKGIKKYQDDYRLIIFGGTWCEDTRDLLPKLYKVLQVSGFDMNAIEMYGVNRDKQALNIEHQLYNIQKVPTIILMHQYREIGRIIETVPSTIESALLDIMEKDAPRIEKMKAGD